MKKQTVRSVQKAKAKSSTTGSRGKTSTGATTAGQSGRTKQRTQTEPTPSSSVEDPVASLIAATRPLLAFFADVDSVFTETDAFSDEKIKMGFGRCYRSWKLCRTQLDPEFRESQYLNKEHNLKP